MIKHDELTEDKSKKKKKPRYGQLTFIIFTD